jgi:hypothetical protein
MIWASQMRPYVVQVKARTSPSVGNSLAGRYSGFASWRPPSVPWRPYSRLTRASGARQFAQVGGRCAEQAGELAEAPVGEWRGLALGRREQHLAVLVVVDGQRIQAAVRRAGEIAGVLTAAASSSNDR